MAKILLTVLLLAATVYIVATLQAQCQKKPPKTALFTANKTCDGSRMIGNNQCCCLCNGKKTGKPPGAGTGYYCNRDYCNGEKSTTKRPPAVTTTKTPAGSTSTTAAGGSTSTTAGSTSTTAGSTSTTTGSTSTTTGSTSTTTGSTTTTSTTTTSTTASG